MLSSNKILIMTALLAYILSKIMSASRSMIIMTHFQISISGWENLKLYWAGMFYNQMLPGGIGGDIYKTIKINKLHSDGLLISAGSVIIDRLAGVTILLVLALLCLPFTDLYIEWGWITYVGIPLTLAGFTALILIILPTLKPHIFKILGLSLLVQLFQIISIILIISALGIKSHYIEYILIFLISSVAAMLPLSIGGMGIRELVFLAGSGFLFTDEKSAIAISLIFYLISVFSSLPGALFQYELKSGASSEINRGLSPQNS
jgi:uncharacterized membrane protein YbhN (UPF0104 family)